MNAYKTPYIELISGGRLAFYTIGRIFLKGHEDFFAPKFMPAAIGGKTAKHYSADMTHVRLTALSIRPRARASLSRCQLHRKRESLHDGNG